MRKMLAGLLAGVLLLSGCTAQAAAKSDDTAAVAQQPAENAAVQGGFTENQTLDGADGIIHFSYYLPDGYDSAKTYPLIVAMPGYGEMWFGEDSAGSNLRWNGVQAWTKLSEPVILVSGQLTDWGAKSARQANELAEYMIDHFSVDTSRVYAAGYSAGGETMSQAVALRPDLYAAYIHGGSSGTAPMTPWQKTGWRSISSWRKTTSITALKRRVTPMRTSTPPMKRQGRLIARSTSFCSSISRATSISTPRAFTITMAAAAWCSTMRTY